MGVSLIYALNAFLVTALLITWIRPLAVRFALVDVPDARKHHEGVVPVCGGLAMLAAVIVSNLALGFDAAFSPLATLCIGAIAVTGFVDDRRQLAAMTRLMIQSVTAIVLVVFCIEGQLHLDAVLPPDLAEYGPAIGSVVAVVFIAGTINAVNMMDGVDGLAGGYIGLSFFWLALLAQAAGRPEIAAEALMLMAAVIGFLVFNLRHRWRSRASVFMGDAGSTMLGAAIAYLLLRLASGPGGLSFPLLLWLVVVPVTDTLLLMASRIAAGHSPFRPDRRHLHHLLQDRGFSPGQTAALLIAISFACGAIAYGGLLLGIPDTVMAFGLLLPVSLHAAFVATRTRRLAPEAQAAAPAPPLSTKPLDQTPGSA